MRAVIPLSLLLFACKEPAPPTSLPDCTIGFADRDGDGFGNPQLQTSDCQEPVVQNGDDCNDQFSTAFPGAPEICDGVDNDCDGAVDSDDDEIDLPLQFLDNDGDGFGGGVGVVACDALPDHVAIGGDCDDTNADVAPDVLEICDGVDNNCDGEIDDDDLDDFDFAHAQTWFIDADGDGFAGPIGVAACHAPPGGSTTSDDCNDTDPAAYPNAEERCNGMDDDCDGFDDQGPCESFDGAYTGVFTLTMTNATTHTCTGTLSLTHDLFATPPIQGSYSCTFATTQGWHTEQHGAIMGIASPDGSAAGSFITLDGQQYNWTGSMTAASGGGLWVLGTRTFDVDADWTLSPTVP